MAMKESGTRFRWKKSREKDLWAYVEGRVAEGSSVTSALKEFAKKHGMPWLTARWKYYQLRRLSAPDKTVENRPRLEGQDFLESLAEIVAAGRDTGQDVETFVKGLSRLAVLSREGVALRREREIRLESLRQDATALSSVHDMLAEWLGLPQVDKVGSLKDFSSRLEHEIGNLAAVRDRMAGAS